MQYLNNTFWRMIVGFMFIVVMAMGFLFLSQFYGDQSDQPQATTGG